MKKIITLRVIYLMLILAILNMKMRLVMMK